ncbi:MAG TPA: type VI secretion system-associated protein TagF [Rhodopila sp.]|nr:type VI secretion system-associated protein TagF [Rhodopila sp.]
MSQTVAPPGFFGKVPARGDFLVRRMPVGFQPAWETWLSALVVAARSDLGPAWPDAWLTAPLWHFTLGRDLVGPFGAAGVLLASVDRVGRFFPLSIIGAAAPRPDLLADDWARSAEALALAALEDDFEPDYLDAALCKLGPPPAVTGVERTGGVWRLPIEGGWPARGFDALAESAWLPAGPGQSTWWCRGSGRMVAVHARTAGLPQERLAAAMVTGQFDAAEGGDAARDPGCLGIGNPPPPESVATVGTGKDEASTVVGAPVEPFGHAVTAETVLPIDMNRVDPLGDESLWSEVNGRPGSMESDKPGFASRDEYPLDEGP